VTQAGVLDQPPEPTGSLEGAGLFSDLADVFESASTGSTEIGADVTATAISALGFIDNPLDELLSAGVGWLIEHVSFLREPLDALAGDPAEIVASGRTWAAISTELTTIAAQRESGAAGLTTWRGQSATAYQRRTATLSAPAIRAGAQAADVLSRQTLAAAALIGTVRSVIRDLVADFVAFLIERAAIAVASSVLTAGGSVAAFIAHAVTEGVAVAHRCIAKLTELVRKLGEMGAALGAMRAALGGVIAKLASGVTSAVAHAVGEPGGKVLEVVVEGQKQAAGRYDDYSDATSGREH
jgi:hypothetical protein